MKKNIINAALMLLSFATLLSFTACHDEDEAEKAKAPVIQLTEVGHDNEKHAHPGDDLHLEGDIIAEGLIKSILVEIHQEDGDYEMEFKYDDAKQYSKYIGVRNCEFHEHIDIPEDAPLGEYHLHVIVTDQQGQTGSAKSELTMVAEDDDDDDDHDHNHNH
ncbi:MAG: DUF4625 domain-containing protein [Paludibacteraceae bacterium]|nr:DUF4625 domain-containing protein [Paludibacteraceae bacterium]MBR5971818.1 DUF4625 domain-containing protein [Paludibacteraceae bacterium]